MIQNMMCNIPATVWDPDKSSTMIGTPRRRGIYTKTEMLVVITDGGCVYHFLF